METPDTSSPRDPLSYIMPIGYCNSPTCGYCHNDASNGKPNKRYSYYTSSHSLTPQLYQTLLDRCWRRSGTLLYRPNQRKACCPHYSIRLDADAFHASRDQRQTVNRFSRFIIGDTYSKEAARVNPRSRADAKRRDTTFDLIERIHEAESSKLPPLLPSRHHKAGKIPKTKGDDNGQAPSIPPGADSEPAKAIEPAHRFEVTLEPDTFSDEKYAVFENYQRVVHKEAPSKISKRGFTNFLCNSPLRRETVTDSSGRQKKLGSFHQCYRLDGRLVAIGVLDLLPQCVSAVYFLYHESIHDHSPGKLGALREIALALEGGYRWWYSGYYIHSCPKMRYKIDFAPQYVLDPELPSSWDLLDKEALAMFDKQPYVSFSHERLVEYKRELLKNHANSGNGENLGFGLFGIGKPLSFHGQAADELALADDVAMSLAGEDPGALNTASDGETHNGSDEELESDDNGSPNVPLFTSNMPGLPPMTSVARYELDNLPILTSLQPGMFPVNHLAVWDEGTVMDGTSFKNKVAELVAMMGADLIPQLCLDFRRYPS